MKKLLVRMLVGVALVIGLAPLAFRLWLTSTVAPLRGREVVAGLADSVVVLWDSLAVPHIIANSDTDLFAALGYLQARDRLWEMELLRHAALGRLSELFGARAVGDDRFLRALEMGRIARTKAGHMSAEAQRVGEAYVRGVNAWITHGQLPVELHILGHRPEPWTREHSVAIGVLEAWDLRSDGGELERLDLPARLSPQQAADLFPGYPHWGPVIVPRDAWSGAAAHGRARVDLASDDGGHAAASNAWAIGPAHTKSGKPILANDPHLTLRAPSIWYLVGIHAPGYDVVGATIPGLPPVVLGHNARLGWGFTNGMIDDVDYTIEQLSPDSTRYRTSMGWAATEAVAETILVKGGPSVMYTRRRTAQGPLVVTGWHPDSGRALAMRWTAQDSSDEMSALLGMARSRDRASFLAALRSFRSPEQNIVYADADGTIGYSLAGFVPVRAAGDGATAAVGWMTPVLWTGFLAEPELPRMENPASGFIVTANNRIVGDAYPHAIDAQYEPPYRAQRIWEVAPLLPQMTAAGVAAQQTDRVSVFARQLVPTAEAAAAALGRRDIAAELHNWGGSTEADRREPTLFWMWFRELQRLTYEDESPDFRPTMALVGWILAGGSPWFDDVRTPETEDLQTMARRAMETVLAKGPIKPWGMVHAVIMEHPLGDVPVIGWLAGFNIGPLSVGGDNMTVNVCPSNSPTPPFVCTEGPSMRHVVDFGNVDSSGGFILPAGQSGNPASPHYRDQTERWLKGQLWILPVDVRRVVAPDTLRLIP